MRELHLSTTGKQEAIDITDDVQREVAASGVREGICLVYAPHATAAVLLMEADGAVEQDVLASLSNLVPKTAMYRHQHGGPGHGASHVQSALFSSSRAVPVANCHLQLGTWQRIVFCELDGPRNDRKVSVQVVGR